LNLAIGLLIHRIPEAFVFGTVFWKKSPELNKMVVITFMLFIITTPIGMGIGIAVDNSKNNWAIIVL
jgi:zinc transporter ZupT